MPKVYGRSLNLPMSHIQGITGPSEEELCTAEEDVWKLPQPQAHIRLPVQRILF
jgi:hypothetical protein